jgi:hypothetical protein
MRALRDVSPAVRAVVAVAATSVLMVLVSWATLIGPDEVFTGPGPAPRTATPTQQASTCVAAVTTTAADGTVSTAAPTDNPDGLPVCEARDTTLEDARDMVEQVEAPLWLRIRVVTLEVLLLLALVAVAALLARAAYEAWKRRPRRAAGRAAVAFDTRGEPARLVAAITEDAEEQDRLLLDGEARNAIVAAWQRFEVQGEAAGVGRRQWETSSEYAIRILDRVAADSGAVNRLAGLYREARFSEHPITEEHRAAALEALHQIRRSLGVRA